MGNLESKIKVDRKFTCQSEADETYPPTANLPMANLANEDGRSQYFWSASNLGVFGVFELFSLGAVGFTASASTFEVLQCVGSASATAKATFSKLPSVSGRF